MKVLLLCGGEGTRLRPFTHSIPKQLLPVVNKPILYHILEWVARTPLREIVIVTGENQGVFQQTVGDGSRWGLKISYVCQPRPLGLAHAVLTAETALGKAPFLMYLGDNLLEESPEEYLSDFEKKRLDSLLLLRKVPDPENYGIAEIKGDRVLRVVEKPEKPPGNLALSGLYLFSPAIFQSIRNISPSARGELEITDAIQNLLDRKKKVEYRLLTGWWLDTGSPDALLEANRRLLGKVAPASLGRIINSRVDGCLYLDKESLIENSKINGPVYIGAGCRIKDSTIGPWVTVGDGGTVTGSTLKNSILFSGARVENFALHQSIIGRRALLTGGHRPDQADAAPLQPFSRLLLGDDGVVS
ncbi:MAG: glucose-1-phosphate thymidylyltransferase [Firmicutes bacterium]|nr:glucose-1-phosphate thymidylyltransferase [Bacillota bacterium]